MAGEGEAARVLPSSWREEAFGLGSNACERYLLNQRPSQQLKG